MTRCVPDIKGKFGNGSLCGKLAFSFTKEYRMDSASTHSFVHAESHSALDSHVHSLQDNNQKVGFFLGIWRGVQPTSG